jgi:hypothetical protein
MNKGFGGAQPLMTWKPKMDTWAHSHECSMLAIPFLALLLKKVMTGHFIQRRKVEPEI